LQDLNLAFQLLIFLAGLLAKKYFANGSGDHTNCVALGGRLAEAFGSFFLSRRATFNVLERIVGAAGMASSNVALLQEVNSHY
jgi:hypothetical protein